MTSQFLENFSLDGLSKIKKTEIIPPIKRIEKSKNTDEQSRENFEETLKRKFKELDKREKKPLR